MTSWTRLTRSTRVTLVALSIPLLALFALVGCGTWITATNDASAKKIEEQLLDIALPADSKLVDSLSLAAKYSGNGNGMQYLGALLIDSNLPLAALQEHYRDRATVTATTDRASLDELHSASGFFNDPGSPRRYIVHNSGDGPGQFFAQWDIRGH